MLPNAFIYNLFLLFPFLHHLLQAMPKRQIALKNYNLLPWLKNINYICNNKPKFHNNVTRLARQT